jgi:hypothetical protein
MSRSGFRSSLETCFTMRARAAVGAAFCLTVLAVCAVGATPALAAPPEEPQIESASAITASSATLHGVLNPNAPGEAGSYQFDYAPSETGECHGGGLAPASPALAVGAEKEAVSAPVTGLEPNREYAFCLVGFSLSAEASPPSAAEHFKTSPLAPEVASESVSGVSPAAATLEAQVNPNNEPTTYAFEYSTTESAKELTGTIVKVAGVSALEGFGDQTASVPTETLLPDTTYFYRVVAENAQSQIESEPVTGEVASFQTAPEAPLTSSPVSATATTAQLEGTLNPLASGAVGWHFAYSNPGGSSCAEGPASVQEAEATVEAQAVGPTQITELQPSAKYVACLVATNAAGESTAGNEVSFETLPEKPKVDSVTASGVTPFEATLEAQVNPDNQRTTYEFEYATSKGALGTAAATKLAGRASLSGFGDQTASVATGHVLAPNTTYFYRVLVENAAHEKVQGEAAFTTLVLKAPQVEGQSSSGVTPFAATLEVTVNPEYQETTCEFEYATSEAAIGSPGVKTVPCATALGSGGGGVGASAAVSGLSSGTSYYFRVVAKNATGATPAASIEKFETAVAEAPAVDSERVFQLTATSAELRTEITTDYQVTTCKLEYATSSAAIGTAGATTMACEPPQVGSQARNSPEAAAVKLAGLAQGTHYFYRFAASNATGSAPVAPIEEFTTLIAPVLTTLEAQSVTRTSVTFAGATVNPEGLETRYHVVYIPENEYKAGAENPYGTAGLTPEMSAGSEASPVPVTAIPVSELKPGTTYDYALVATNAGGTTYGHNQTFTTSNATPPVATTGEAVGVTQTAATLTGTVDTSGLRTMMYFEVSELPSLGSPELASVVPGSENGTTVAISLSFGNYLPPGTTFYYRAVATNADGTSYGVVKTFTTASFAVPPALISPPLLVLPQTQSSPSTTKTGGSTHHKRKPLSRAKKLAKALKACAKKPKSKRAACRKQAHKKFGK